MYKINNFNVIKLSDKLFGGSSLSGTRETPQSIELDTNFIELNTQKLVPILFTYLDGKLNTKFGSNQEINLEFLRINELLDVDRYYMILYYYQKFILKILVKVIMIQKICPIEET